MKKLLILSVLLTCWQFVTAQQVSGTILDGTLGEALIGATIMEKGTENGTITDLDGNFTLDVSSENPIIEVSYIGYGTQEINYDGSPISLSLFEDAETLDEIIVVGYGVQKKKVVTGSITKVDAEALEDKQVVNINGALQGRSAGVRVINNSGQPGDGVSISIRGIGNFGGYPPLYIVDGLVIDGGIEDINPNDIESIEVLKDASASIYGVKSAGGVVLITTKSGTKETAVNYSGSYGWQAPQRKMALTNAAEYAILRNESRAASGKSILFDDPAALGVGTDWQDEVYRDSAPFMTHNLSLSGGGDKSTYFTSVGYTSTDGIVSLDRSSFKRFNLRMNSTHKISDVFSFKTRVGYTKKRTRQVSTNTEFGSPVGRALNMDPITPVYETDSLELADSRYNGNVVEDEGGIYGISKYISSEIVNPIAANTLLSGHNWADKFVASLGLTAKVTDFLKFDATIGVDRALWGGDSFSPLSKLNSTNEVVVNSYFSNQNNGTYLQGEYFATLEKDFSSHKFSLVLGSNSTINTGEGIGSTILNSPATDYESASLQWDVLDDDRRTYGYRYESRLLSYFGRLNYNFQEKYLLTAIYRVDGSTRFGPDNKFGAFPSILLGWNVSDENFFPSNGFIKNLKIRASHGLQGSDNVGDFRYLALVERGKNYSFGEDSDLIIGSAPDRLSNREFSWEETLQTNLGFDAVLGKGFEVNFDIYRRTTKGLLADAEVPTVVGFGSPVANIGEIKNEGVELSASYTKETDNRKFSIRPNISYNRNEVVFIADGVDFRPGYRWFNNIEVTRFSVGEPFGYLFGYKTDGIFQNQDEVDAYVNAEGEALLPAAAPGDLRFVDLNGDGMVNEEDKTKIGNGNAPWSFGLDLYYKYNQFDVSFFAQGLAGNDIMNMTRRLDLAGSNYDASALGRWTGEGSTNEFPRLTEDDLNRNFSRSSDFYLENGSFMKIRNFQIGYNLGESLRDKIGIGKTRIYMTLNNIYTFTKYKGLDPEIGGGVDRGQYQSPRSILIGANINFIPEKKLDK